MLHGIVLLALTPSLSQGDQELWPAARDVLEKRCLECHGGERVKGGLRFADAQSFRQGGHRGPVFDALTPETSRLLHAIGYENPELAMPPDGKLPAEETEALTLWIQGGAAWPADPLSGQLANPELYKEEAAPAGDGNWWAYRPLERPDVPTVRAKLWSEHAIDAFIEARRERSEIEGASEAGPEALQRRATYDLTGLPPTVEQRAAFMTEVRDAGFDRAWAVLIDELLASPHYGEHWARHWLDLVRYAETNGYERDGKKNNAWRYRDWVIRSLNDDKTYDRFVTEQLAGDELAAADGDGELSAAEAEALLGTGYYRLGVWDDEPSDPKQALADELADIVDTTGQVFLGTTVGCARCHDHKADPIRQKDYYALTAIFNNLTSYGGGGFGQHLGGGMLRPVPDSSGPFVFTPDTRRKRIQEIENELKSHSQRLGVDLPSPEPIEKHVLVADARDENGAANWRYLSEPADEGWHTPSFDDSSWTEGVGGFGNSGAPGSRVETEWTSARIHLRTRFRLTEIPEAVVLSFHHDEDVAVFVNGQQVLERSGYRSNYTEVQLDEVALTTFVVGSNVVAVVCSQTGGGQYIDVGLRTGLGTKPKSDWLAELKNKVRAHASVAGAKEVRALLDRRKRVLASPFTEPYGALVASEKGPQAAEQHVLFRGSAHAEGDVVEAAVPLIFQHSDNPDFGGRAAAFENSTGRRLAFARWLFAEGSFLTARVMANRLWQFHFGRGLCASPGDFGRLGVEPTHPELLDHLAIELIERGWSLKAMHRYLMSSRTYRMASVGNSRALAADPRNRLYWRFDPRRLTAEEFRDGVLATNGTLNTDLFGPSVYPPMAAEVLATASRPNLAWGSSPPEDVLRRSIYVFVKRSLRLPLLESLDQPDPDLPCPARFPTNVPTQALITMNGSFVQEHARLFAQRLLQSTSGLEDCVTHGLTRALGRLPSAQETKRNLSFIEELRAEYELDDEGALSLFCLGLYNRNEFIWID